jgi:subtilisin family serine protease
MTITVRRMLIAGSIVALCTNIPSDLKAQAAGSRRLQPASQTGRLQTTFLPRGVNQPPVTVVAILGGQSVADVQETAGRRLTRQEKDAVKASRRVEQDGPRSAMQGLGGRVLASFQSALNGIKLRIPANQLDALRAIPGVVDVKPVTIYKHENVIGVPRIGAPLAWAGVNGVRGEGVKVAIIDTGIDFTHANFGGPGTPAAYQAAFMNDTLPADPSLFGPNAPKVKGGTDLVGDAYNASGDEAAATPHPDPNPLDCNGHGSHVAGTAAGFGVLTTGTTFPGPYDQLTHKNFSFIIGPGVAPKADLYAVRVFGCEGSTDVVTEALDWAVDHDMDVVNMSLGSDFGDPESADALAADNTMKAGVMVVMSAGNAGNIPYIAGSPGVSRKGIAVAATVNPAFYTTANLSLPAVGASGAKTVTALNANAAALPGGTLTVKVLRTATGGASLGCNPADYGAQNVTGKLVVVVRGTCARVARAIYGQQAGAAAVVMINNTTDLPPFEGPITQNPDTGDLFTVSIPFLGVRGVLSNSNSDGSQLVARDGLSIGIASGVPIQTGTASFSSSGPSLSGAHLKPEIAAPGEAVTSTLVGSGNQSLTISGTSMAAPFVTGTAALVIQAHPQWKPAAVKSALINSANPDGVNDYVTRRVGTGVVNAAAAVGTQAYAFADRDETTLNFGLEEFSDDLHLSRTVHIKNDSRSDITFNVTTTNPQGSPHTITLGVSNVTVPARGQSTVPLTFELPAATAGNSGDFREAAGLITFTPSSSTANRGIALRVPYYIVPRVSSNVTVTLAKLKGNPPSGSAIVENRHSPIPATADFYAWGLESGNDRLGRVDLRAAGVQSLDFPGDKILVFAINTFKAWSAPSMQEFDVFIDSDDDGVPDFDVFSDDFGLVVNGSFTGEIATFILDLHTGALSADFDAVAPTDGSTILLPVLASSIGVAAAQPRFSYSAAAFDLFSSDSDQFDTSARFNAFASAISNGQFEVVDPDATVSVPVTVNPAEFASTPAKGLMVVTQDDKNGAAEANLVKVKF